VEVKTKVRAEQYDLALAWMTATVIGGLAIGVIPEGLGPWRMLAPLGAMAGYLIFAFTRSQHTTQRVADSTYFMGFLWTLWALINVLVWHPGLKASELYVAFGYALITTASGMFVRLALLQFYRTVDDQREEAVDRIDEGVLHLVSELEQAAANMRANTNLAFQDWHRTFVEASDQIVGDVKHMARNLSAEGDAMSAAVRNIQQTLTATNRHVVTFEKWLDGSTARTSAAIEERARALEVSMEALATRLEDIKLRPGLIESRLEEVLDSVRDAAAPVAQMAVSTLADLKQAIDGVARSVTELPTNTEVQAGVMNVINKLNLVSHACEHLTRAARETENTLASIGAEAAAVLPQIGGMERKVGDVQARLESVRTTVESAARDAGKVDAAVKDAVRLVRSAIGQPR
jgi:hypothetical protein